MPKISKDNREISHIHVRHFQTGRLWATFDEAPDEGVLVSDLGETLSAFLNRIARSVEVAYLKETGGRIHVVPVLPVAGATSEFYVTLNLDDDPIKSHVLVCHLVGFSKIDIKTLLGGVVSFTSAASELTEVLKLSDASHLDTSQILSTIKGLRDAHILAGQGNLDLVLDSKAYCKQQIADRFAYRDDKFLSDLMRCVRADEYLMSQEGFASENELSNILGQRVFSVLS